MGVELVLLDGMMTTMVPNVEDEDEPKDQQRNKGIWAEVRGEVG